jgi:N-acetylglucosaminyldiphosphoundecaprenol N-acetyl-beta-D-mannosaminyltransferase
MDANQLAPAANAAIPVSAVPPTETSVLADAANRRRRIAGIDFDFVIAAEVASIIASWRRCGARNYISITNPHSVMVCRRDRAMHEATAGAALTFPDGVGIILAARLLGYGRRYRVTGPNLMLKVCDQGRTYGLRHFFLGGSEGVAQRLAERLSTRFSGLLVAGTCTPPFRRLAAGEDQELVDRISAAAADVVWVGLGAPKQEKWMATHVGKIQATTMIGVGAAFDFHSGNAKWAPFWIRKLGLEWAHRFALNPRRMWRRNLDSPLFLGIVGWQVLHNTLCRLTGAPNDMPSGLAELAVPAKTVAAPDSTDARDWRRVPR